MLEDPQPFVGRVRGLNLLHQRFLAAFSRRGQVAIVTGEVGSGKSSVLIEFGHRAHAVHE